MACVDLPAFPLQLLLARHPEWKDRPAAVVDCDKPQGKILWINERARALRVLPGMRYAAALSLAGDLQAAVVSEREIDRSVASLRRRLQYFTPHVEPAAGEPGVFWLDATGLERLHDSLSRWAALIRSNLEQAGFRATTVVGFTRFGSYALARARRGILVLKTPDDERAAARRVPLDRLALEPRARDTLYKLGIQTVGGLVDLPPEGIEKRFGAGSYRLHRLAAGERSLPLQPDRPLPPVWQRLQLDHPEANAKRLMFAIERLMPPLLEELASRGHALNEVRVGFRFERAGDHIESVRPATPTLDAGQLLGLIRLRLEAVRKLPDGVVEVVLIARGGPATSKQLQLFGQPRRDLAAANRALARVRAALGDARVTRAQLREGHLPEASFSWENLDALKSSTPRATDAGRLIRRIHARPLPLPQRSRRDPDGWLLQGLQQGPVVRLLGPYVVSGGWWNRSVHREYHFAETRKGELLWIFYDRVRRRWFLQGQVE